MSDTPFQQVDHAALKKAKDDSVAANIKVLESFYAFLISFALTQATMKLADGWIADGISFDTLGRGVLYISLLITIVPFYQGMNRFLYVTHVVRPIEKPNSRTSPILLDIYAFLLMSCVLFAMGRFLDNPIGFFYLWSGLLALDIVWSLLVWFIQRGRAPKWAANNMLWLVLAWVYWIIFQKTSFSEHFGTWAPVGLYGFVLFEIARTVCDYSINWSFYFPLEYRGSPTEGEIEDAGSQRTIVYLAGPYSNDAPSDPSNKASPAKRLARFDAVTEVARQLIEAKEIIYSPLTMTHPIDLRMENDPGSKFWVGFDEAFMEHCGRIIVIKLPGWEASTGVQHEIKFFAQRGITAEYRDPGEFGIDKHGDDFAAAFE